MYPSGNDLKADSNYASDRIFVEYGAGAIITITAILCTLFEIVDTTIVPWRWMICGNAGATLTEVGWWLRLTPSVTWTIKTHDKLVIDTVWPQELFCRFGLYFYDLFLCVAMPRVWEIHSVFAGYWWRRITVTSQTIITEKLPGGKRSMVQAIYGCGCDYWSNAGPPPLAVISFTIIPFAADILYQYSHYVIATLFTLQYVRSPKYVPYKSSARDVDWLCIICWQSQLARCNTCLKRADDDDWFNSTTIIVRLQWQLL